LGKRRKEFANGKGPLRAERAGARESLGRGEGLLRPFINCCSDGPPPFFDSLEIVEAIMQGVDEKIREQELARSESGAPMRGEGTAAAG
jgi:hypothetical protein